MTKPDSHSVPKKLRILLSNNYGLVGAGLRSLLEKEPGLEIVGETNLGPKSSAIIFQARPDVIFVTLSTATFEEVEMAERMMEKFPRPILLLALNTSVEYVLQSLHAGIKGILCLRSSANELQVAIQKTAAGEVYLSPALPKSVMDAARDYLLHQGRPVEQLTSRQKTILKLITEGRNTKEIALRLKVSSKTIEFHRARLMERLGIFDIAGLVRYALRLGLVEL
ncbi:MAG TPA: response regulator transcription factor [Verrucomicrobiae bacterium]